MFNVGGYDFQDYRSDCASITSISSDTNSKKRGSSFIDGSEDDRDLSKMPRTSADWNKRQNHSEIEKRRRDKMNTYIMELSSIIPVCTSRKLDKLTVLRMAVQHMKMLRGSLHSYTEGHYKPSFLSDDELKNLILHAADGFVFVVGCDRGRILYVSETVYQTLQYGKNELLGTSWFDILHPKDLVKVKEQLSCTNINRRERLVDAKTLLPVKADLPQSLTRLCPGARRAFFCRMKCKSSSVMKEEADTTTGCPKKRSKSSSDRKYCVIHFTGYLKSWATNKDPLEEDSENDNENDTDSCNSSVLVAVGRVHRPLLSSTTNDGYSNRLLSRPIEFISKHTIDGKYVYIDQRASLLLGWLPQELLGSSMYEYFHQDDVSSLAETHRITLQSSEPQRTQNYRFRTKDGSHIQLQGQWRTFKNPWTKEVEYIIASTKLITSDAGMVESSSMMSDSGSAAYGNFNEFLGSPGGNSSTTSSRIHTGGMQPGKIGRQIADEVLENQRRDSSSNSPVSPFEGILGSGASDRSFAALLKPEPTDKGIVNNVVLSGSASDISPRQQQTNSITNSTSFQPSPTNSQENFKNKTPTRSQENDLMDVVSNRDLETDGTSDSDEAAMAVIMSLLEADAGLGGPVDFSHLPWPLP